MEYTKPRIVLFAYNKYFYCFTNLWVLIGQKILTRIILSILTFCLVDLVDFVPNRLHNDSRHAHIAETGTETTTMVATQSHAVKKKQA